MLLSLASTSLCCLQTLLKAYLLTRIPGLPITIATVKSIHQGALELAHTSLTLQWVAFMSTHLSVALCDGLPDMLVDDWFDLC